MFAREASTGEADVPALLRLADSIEALGDVMVEDGHHLLDAADRRRSWMPMTVYYQREHLD